MSKFKWIFLIFLTVTASFTLAPSVIKEVSATNLKVQTQPNMAGNGYVNTQPTQEKSIRKSITIICESIFNDEEQYVQVYTIAPNAPKESIDIWRKWLAGSK